ncbi:MAG TPA: HlyD family efflux transporter periplasmic adaptor subunit [Rhodocyclaceae bacterium]|nr:HlyD family efflux transporter periplasmic adaptor subunit [Rhodocyclaceae bacterium]
MSAISDLTAPPTVPIPAAGHLGSWPRALRLRRLAKFAGVIVVLAIGAYAALANQGYVVTDNAVVSAYRMKLRTPIAGELTTLSARVGAKVPAGSVLARVHLRRIDGQHLADLRQTLNQATAALAADRRQRDQLMALRAGLRLRAEADLHASRNRLGGLLVQAAATLRKAEAMRELARLNLTRLAPLVAEGVATPAARDGAVAALASATASVAGDRGQLAAIAAQAAAAAQGVLLDNGGNDVPYSAQRADEVAIELARLEREITTTRAQVAGLRTAIGAERQRLDLLAYAVLRAPGAGTVWKLDAVAGEHLTAGESVAELVDCARPVVLAAIPDDDATRIVLGGRVRLRLTGETKDRPGRVIGIGGARFRDHGRALAAIPAPRQTPREIVRIALDAAPAPGAACLVGRSLRVMIPARGEGMVARWLAHVM